VSRLSTTSRSCCYQKVKNLNDYLRQKSSRTYSNSHLCKKLFMDVFLCYLKSFSVAGCFYHEVLELDFFYYRHSNLILYFLSSATKLYIFRPFLCVSLIEYAPIFYYLRSIIFLRFFLRPKLPVFLSKSFCVH